MPAFPFDPLKAARALTAAGAKEPLAEAIVTTMNDAVTEGVATKADVAELKAGISAIEWAPGFVAAVRILMAGRPFGGFRPPGGNPKGAVSQGCARRRKRGNLCVSGAGAGCGPRARARRRNAGPGGNDAMTDLLYAPPPARIGA